MKYKKGGKISTKFAAKDSEFTRAKEVKKLVSTELTFSDYEYVPLTISYYLTISYDLYFLCIFGVCNITGQYRDFRVKYATLCLVYIFWYFFVVFHQKIVFPSFSFIFLIKHQISTTEC